MNYLDYVWHDISVLKKETSNLVIEIAINIRYQQPKRYKKTVIRGVNLLLYESKKKTLISTEKSESK